MSKKRLLKQCRRTLAATVFVIMLVGNSIGQYTTTTDSLQPQKKQFCIDTTGPHIKVQSFILPAAFITLGAISVHNNFPISNSGVKNFRDRNFSGFHTSLDNYLQFVPTAVGYGMLIGSKEHRFWPYTKKVVLTEAIMLALVYPTKTWVAEIRPDSGSPNSFPSGHTAQAFASATVFADEFGQHRFWLQASAYTCATAVAALRVLNNRHYIGDVVAGAGFGILSAKLSSWIIEPHGRKVYYSSFQKL